MKVWIFLLMFFAIAALLIISNNSLALYDSANRQTFTNLYLGWLEDIYSNSFELTGNIIKLDWLPKE